MSNNKILDPFPLQKDKLVKNGNDIVYKLIWLNYDKLLSILYNENEIKFIVFRLIKIINQNWLV